MRSRLYACVKLSLSLVLAAGVAAAATHPAVAQPDLSRYSVIISDTGDRYYDDSSDTRVHLEASDGYNLHEEYFDDLPSAFFVLRQRFGTVQIENISVATADDGVANGKRVWYFWDDRRMARGGVPLILAFTNR